MSSRRAQAHAMHNGSHSGAFVNDAAAKNAARKYTRTKRLSVTLIASHVAVVIGIVGIIGVGYKAPVEASALQQANHVVSALDQGTPSVDQIAAAEVATSVAELADLSVENSVKSLSISLAGKTELAQTDNNFLNKPQIVQQNSGRKGVITYTAKEGDTVQSVAAAHGISEDSVRWANNQTSDAIAAGRKLTLPAITGIIYMVRPGDDAAKLAERYKADKDRIIIYNDAELSGLAVGQRIVIPDGILPETERPGYRAPSRIATIGDATVLSTRPTVYAGNQYAYGFCTYYAYNRRAELGRPIGSNWGNASTWASYARAAGFRVDRSPEPGAVFQTGGGWYGLGHVGIVERVNPDGSFVTSEMNYGRWNVVSSRTISASEARSYSYIH